MTPAARRTAWVMLVGGALLFVGLAWWLVPWDPVPGGPVEPVRADDYFTAEHIARAEEYSWWARLWSLSSLGVSIAVACWLGFSRRGRAWAERAPGPWSLQVVLLVAAVELTRRLVTLPFALALEDHRRDYGLSTRSWSGFGADVVRTEALGIVVLSLVLLVVIGLARRLPRAWPAVAGGVLAALVVLGSFVYPVLVEPAFNDFAPLEDGPLRQGVVDLANRMDVEVDEVLVADASRRTSTLNAYVSGFGSTRRVVLYDTLVRDLPQNQALSVVAHELAHAANHDVFIGTVIGAAAAVTSVGVLSLIVGWFGRWLVGAPGSAVVVPLWLALIAVGSTLLQPIENGISRRIEARADTEALVMTDRESFIAMQLRLARGSLAEISTPEALEFWFGSHPDVLERIAVADRYVQ